MAECIFSRNCNKSQCDKEYCMRKDKIEYLFSKTLLSTKDMQKISLHVDADKTDFNEFVKLNEIENNILDFVNNGKNMFIYSGTAGNGKSSWAKRMIQAYIYKTWIISERRCTALFVDVSAFLVALKDNISNYNEYANYVKQNINNAELVVFDDICTSVATDYEINQLFSIINFRINSGKSCIFTANISADKLYDSLGARIASRVLGSDYVIELHGGDKRRKVEEN